MRTRLTVLDRRHVARDVVIDAPTGATLGDIRGELAAALDLDTGLEWWSGRRLLVPSAALGATGLRDGDVVTVGRPGEDAQPDVTLHLAAVSGPAAGATAGLSRGVHVVGRDPGCDLVLADPDVSRRHAAVTVTAVGITVRDLDSRNGTTLEGEPVDRDGDDLPERTSLRVGNTVLELRAGAAPPAATRASGGSRVVVRATEAHPTPAAARLQRPAEVAARPRPRTAWVAALLPAVAAAGLAWAMHTWGFLAFAALSPLTVLGTAAGDRWHWRSSRRRAATDHAERLAEFERRRREVLDAERVARGDRHPDPVTCAQAAAGPTRTLWRRRPDDADFLWVRVGTAARPSLGVGVDERGAVAPLGTVADVPVCADLRRGALGVAGPDGHARAVVRSVLLQLVTTHAPSAVDLVVVTLPERRDAWAWLRWLPHEVTVVDERADAAAALAALAEQVRNRGQERAPATLAGRWTVLVVEGVGGIAEDPALETVLRDGPAGGVCVIALDRDPAALPARCASVAAVDGPTHAGLVLGGRGWDGPDGTVDLEGPVLADQVELGRCEGAARALASLDDGGGTDGVPREVRLADVVERPDAATLAAAWSTHDGRTDDLRAPIGLTAGAALVLDLTRDGPHALVVGTTGAGKSELLQSWVASLALTFPPDDLTLLLVDYKGGAAFGACARLPHAVGLVTDLDPHLTARVLRSLDAEIRLRERLLSTSGALDLAAHRSAGGPPVARLVVVVDEFATLAADLPDFVPGLVDIAQRGRSLGIHLVLATQRPGAAVSPAIRANTSLRLALRVAEAAESVDVIGVPDAARIDRSTPGRVLVRTGVDLTTGQTAWAGAPVVVGDVSAEPVRVTVVGPWDSPAPTPPVPGRRTDLEDVVDLVGRAWERRSATGVPAPRATWRPPLPERLDPADLAAASRPGAGPSGGGHPRGVPVAVGLRDEPAAQRQLVEELDLAVGGTVFVAGAGRTGRTGVLATLAHAAARTGMPTVLVDGGGSWAGWAGVGSTVAHVPAGDADVLARAVDLLEAEFRAREGAPGGEPLLVVVDDWSTVVAALDDLDAGRATERMVALWRAAGSRGVTVAVAGDRSLLAPRYAVAADRTYLLRLPDRSDYALAGIAARDVPEHMPTGRALRAPGGDEVQFALPPAAPPGTSGTAPRTTLRLRPLPPRAAVTEGTDPRGVPLGVGGDTAEPLTVDLWAGARRWLVTGPPRSGRSTALVTLAVGAAGAGARVAWWARPHSPVATALRDRPDCHRLAPDASSLDAVEPARMRHASRHAAGGELVLVVVDDVDGLADAPLSEALAALLVRGPDTVALVCSGRPEDLLLSYRGVVAEVRRARQGLVLRPGPGDGDLIGVRTGRARASSPPGRGTLVADGVRLGGRRVPTAPLTVQVGLVATAAEVAA